MFSILHKIIHYSIFCYFSRVRKSITTFNFHQVSFTYDKEIHLNCTWTNLLFFEKQLLVLKKRYEFIPIKEAFEKLANGSIDKNYAVLTFDDGDASVKQIMPILTKRNIPATFFINTAYLDDKKKSWVNAQTYIKSLSNTERVPQEALYAVDILRNTRNMEEYNKYRVIAEDYINEIQINKNQYLTTEELNSISNPLFSIGLHGHEHQRYSMMNTEWCENDIDTGINILSKHPLYIPVIAFPFGKPNDWDEKTVSICLNKGLKIMLHNGGVNYKKNILYNRIPSDGRNMNLSFLASNFIS